MRLVVIGAGAAGMLCAAVAAAGGAAVTVLEKNEKCGKKIYITGKGRCNVTNTATGDAFLRNVMRNPRFLLSALARFDSEDLMAYLARYGLALKQERGGRVFPVSDHASDVTRTLERAMAQAGAQVRLGVCVQDILHQQGRVTGVQTDHGVVECDAVAVCTGGISYPSTGSTGDGYRFARQTGHRVTELFASLVGLETVETWPQAAQGLTLKNVALRAKKGKKTLFDEQGELLMTHFGVSGPLALSLSSVISGMALDQIAVSVDLKPALTPEMLEKRLLRDFEKYTNRYLIHALDDLMPQRMIAQVLAAAGVDGQTPVNQLRAQSRQALAAALKAMPLTIAALRPVQEAVVTRGGVHVGDVDPRTMASKKIQGLYFAGEVLDVDGLTGGYNLQIAFSTAYSAAMGVLAQQEES